VAQTVCILLNPGDRHPLEQIAGDRNRPHEHVQRPNIVLLSGDRLSCWKWRALPASAGRRSGVGSNALPKRVPTACWATRPANPAPRRSPHPWSPASLS
jgi:hypothetical protein